MKPNHTWCAAVSRFARIASDKIVTRSGLQIEHLREDLREEAEAAVGLWVYSREDRAARLGLPEFTVFDALAGRESKDWPPSLWIFAVRTVLMRAARFPDLPNVKAATNKTWQFHALFIGESATGPIDREFRALWVNVRCDLLTESLRARVLPDAKAERAAKRWESYLGMLRRYGLVSIYGDTFQARKEASALLAVFERRMQTLRHWLIARPPRARRKSTHQRANCLRTAVKRERAQAKAARLSRPIQTKAEVVPVPLVQVKPVAPIYPRLWHAFAQATAARVSLRYGLAACYAEELAGVALRTLGAWVKAIGARWPRVDVATVLSMRARRAVLAGVNAFTYWPCALVCNVRTACETAARQTVRQPARTMQLVTVSCATVNGRS